MEAHMHQFEDILKKMAKKKRKRKGKKKWRGLSRNVRHKLCDNWSFCPASRKFQYKEKYLTIRTISKYIAHHCVAIITTIHCILLNQLEYKLACQRNTDKSMMLSTNLTPIDHSYELLLFSPSGNLTPAMGWCYNSVTTNDDNDKILFNIWEHDNVIPKSMQLYFSDIAPQVK